MHSKMEKRERGEIYKRSISVADGKSVNTAKKDRKT